MNIVQAYLKFNKQYIIAFSGLPKSGKTTFGKFMGKTLDFEIIEMKDYFFNIDINDSKNIDKIDYNSGKIDVVNCYNIKKHIDWDRLNNYVNSIKSKIGIILIGLAFPRDNIKFSLDFHLYI